MSALDIVATPFKKVFGTRNDRLVKNYRRRAEEIGTFEPAMRRLSDAQLREKTQELRRRVADGARPGDVLAEAFAVMRESLDRNVGIRNIFNPAHKAKFPLDKLPAAARTLHDQVQAEI